MTSSQVKKMRQLEVAYNYCRHVTKPFVDAFVAEVCEQLHETEKSMKEQDEKYMNKGTVYYHIGDEGPGGDEGDEGRRGGRRS